MSRKILVIEDEDAIRTSFVQLLASSGYDVFGAVNGRFGVEVARREHPDLILSDIGMPELDGFGVLQTLRKDPTTATIPFIFLTGLAEHVEFPQGMHLSADDCLAKPCGREELLQVVEARLKKSDAVSERYRSETEQAEERLVYLLNYDSLTGLPNHTLLRQLLRKAVAANSSVAVICIELERFQRVREALGDPFGEVLMKLVAERLRALSPEMILARSGVEEFTALLHGSVTEQEVDAFTHKIINSINRSFILDTHEIFIGAAAGISRFPADGNDVDHLLTSAAAAAHSAQKAGRPLQFYASSMSSFTATELDLEAELRHALDNDEFRVYYQPQIDLRTGLIAGAEALVRWNHPEKGIISPNKFIPIAEETGLIQAFGKWILRSACEQVRKWHNAGYQHFRIGVNLSGVQFGDPELLPALDEVIRQTEIASSSLELELTESVLMKNVEQTLRILSEIKAKGIALSIDDFGTGYSSLSYLKQFPLDTLKVDQSFVRNIAVDSKNAALTKAIIEMAKNLNLRVIAEGVESSTELFFLYLHNCDEVQGYFFSPPLPAADFEALLRSGKRMEIRPK